MNGRQLRVLKSKRWHERCKHTRRRGKMEAGTREPAAWMSDSLERSPSEPRFSRSPPSFSQWPVRNKARGKAAVRKSHCRRLRSTGPGFVLPLAPNYDPSTLRGGRERI